MDELIKSWKAEEQAPFEGWDFSYLDGRMIEDEPPWDYIDRAKSLMSEVDSVLDMDTGGGERLLDMQSHWPTKVVASEGYEPNVKLARERLLSFPTARESILVPPWMPDNACPHAGGEHSGMTAN